MKSLLLLIFTGFSFMSYSQNVNMGGVFPTLDHTGKLTKKWEYGLYYFGAFPLVNLKSPNIKKDSYFNLFYLEQSVSYILNQHFSFTGSHVYQRANVVKQNYVNENRFYIQSKYKRSFKKYDAYARIRFDGRFIQDRITHKSPFTNRIRFLIGIEKFLTDDLYFSAYQESFFNTFKKASVIYAENWAYAGIGKKINTNNKIELGILYISWNTGVKSWFNQYYLQFTWKNKINFCKE